MEKLEDLCSFISGVTFKKTEAVTSPLPGHLAILRAGNISDVLNTQEYLVWVPSGRVSKAQRLQVGDIVMCMSSGSPRVVGKSAQVEEPFIGSAGVFCSIIRPKRAEQQKYLAYWFKSEGFTQWRDNQARGVNIQNLRASQLKLVEIPLPPLPEQKRIAAILARADRVRCLRRYAHELSNTYLQSVFLEMFGDGSRFKTTTLQNLLLDNLKNGLYLPAEKYGSGTPIIRINNFYDGVLGKPEQFKRVRATQQQIEEFMVVDGEILINRVNSLEYLGKCALVQGLVETTLFESNMIRVRVDTDIVLPIYFVRFLTSRQAYSQILQRARKAVNQASINQQDVKCLGIPVPPLPLQQEFAHIVHKFERLRAQQREAERQVEHLFQTLLHRAFRGEL